MFSMPPEPAPLAFIRRFLLWSLMAGIVGTGAELILLGHIESLTQWVPLVILGIALPVLVWHAVSPQKQTVRLVQVLMAAFVLSGFVGVGLHYDGNAEFESELHPTDAGMTFIRHVAAGATPLLAPGSMVLLGLVGIAHTYRHPASGDAAGEETAS
jgi:hypothetical protein